ncbi:MAG: oligopeptide/dipeptide ABC transporter ATP-binding protein, partial [Ezakiella sp.]
VDRLQVIPGATPDPTNLPTGCKFHPRCTECMEICKTEKPPMYEVTPEHYVKCFLYKDSKQVDENGEEK